MFSPWSAAATPIAATAVQPGDARHNGRPVPPSEALRLYGCGRRRASVLRSYLGQPRELRVRILAAQLWPASTSASISPGTCVRGLAPISPHLRLAERVGIRKVIEVAHRFGVTSNIPAFLPVALGSVEVTLQEQVAGYSSFPN